MATTISAADFKVLADQTGLPLSEAQRATLHEAYSYCVIKILPDSEWIYQC